MTVGGRLSRIRTPVPAFAHSRSPPRRGDCLPLRAAACAAAAAHAAGLRSVAQRRRRRQPRAPEIGWREFFRDPRLNALIATALDYNRDLLVAVGRIDVARGSITSRAPTGSPPSSAPPASSAPTAVRPHPGSPVRPTFTLDRGSIGVSVTSFELDFWGRVRNLTDAAKANYLATVQAQRAFQLSLIQDVAATYFAQLETAEQIRLADTTVQSRREVLRIAQVRQRAGLTSALDVRSAESLLAQAEAARAAPRSAPGTVQHAAPGARRRTGARSAPRAASIEQQTDTTLLGAGLPSELLLVRPDILGAEETPARRRSEHRRRARGVLPDHLADRRVGLRVVRAEHARRLRRTDVERRAVGLDADLQPRPPARQRRRRARRRTHRARRVRAHDPGRVQGSDRRARRPPLPRRAGRGAGARAPSPTAPIAQLARARYREGVASYLEVLDAERNLFASEQQLLRLRRTNAENLVALYIALGGGVIERR